MYSTVHSKVYRNPPGEFPFFPVGEFPLGNSPQGKLGENLAAIGESLVKRISPRRILTGEILLGEK